jgi:hypothetical protein
MNIGFETHRRTKEQPRVQIVTRPNPDVAPSIAVIGSGWSIGLSPAEARDLGERLTQAAKDAA